ncbi:MAG: response regulator [Agathobaculum sp.]|uniref:response regulator n=1 Tax=Agathobaculum sp. TaxID=2048138 RepID=UPI0025BBEDA1|nr:response regulator [Agathobaculum sp.]MCI7124814.1 response regulator [Agathobaculum sp.]MDY3711614.1 response regulator [Agathobaculum sp.]
MLIYAVDDMKGFLDALVRAAQGAQPQAEIEGFTRGAQVLARMAERPCDILLTDVDMPGMNGIELAQAVHEQNPATEIVFVTGEAAYNLKQMGVQVERCVYKPVTAERLAQRLDELSVLPPFAIIPPQEERQAARPAGGLLGWLWQHFLH